MKNKILAAVCCAAMVCSMTTVSAFAEEEAVKANGDYKISLITMDSVDQHWVSLKEGAEEEAKKDNVASTEQ